MKNKLLLGSLLIGATACASAAVAGDWLDLNKNGRKDVYEDVGQGIEARVTDLIGQMSLDEKVGQLIQDFTSTREADKLAQVKAGQVGSYIWMAANPKLRNDYQRAAVEGSRLGIPLIFGMDIIHGANLTFPISLGLACSFNPELFEKEQTYAAREARAEGVEWAFAPMCDLARDPRWGRVAETCGEDPYLSALCNSAQVRGFQGTNIAAPDHLAACLKHYVGYSAVTGGRDYNDSEISEWTLRNAHLVSFRAAIQAGAATVMSSFNSLDGIPAVANRHTLTEILRGEWGFKGFVVSDWEAVGETIKWGYAANAGDASRLALTAGNDMDMISGCFGKGLAAEVKAGRVSKKTLDQAVRRVLRVKFELGLFDRPYADADKYDGVVAEVSASGRGVARQCVAESAVLLKNGGAVPFASGLKRVALIGPAGDDARQMVGCWAGRNRGSAVTLAAALKNALGKDCELTVVKGCSMNTTSPTKTLQDGRVVLDRDAVASDSGLDLDKAVAAAKAADIVVMALGEDCGWTGENASRASLGLTGRQQDLFDAVAAAGKPVVAVIFSGRPLVLPKVWERANAVFYVWQPGSEAGNGIADLLLGKASPSGRLSMSVPHDVSQVPAYYNHPITGRPGNGQYRDTTERGSRYPFGFGMTYTTFSYSDVKIEKPEAGKPPMAVATLTNTGKVPGTEVAQLYIHEVACHAGWRPIRELRGFKRVTLKPGESTEVRFALDRATLGYVDRKGNNKFAKGAYQVWIAPSSTAGKPVICDTAK